MQSGKQSSASRSYNIYSQGKHQRKLNSAGLESPGITRVAFIGLSLPVNFHPAVLKIRAGIDS